MPRSQWWSPPWPLQTVRHSRARGPPVTGLTLGRFHVRFEKTTFSAVTRIAPAPVGTRGDAGGFQAWVRYTLPVGHQRLWLTSSELGGGRYINGAVAIRFVQPRRTSAQCPELPARYRPVHLDGGLWLGASVATIERRCAPRGGSASRDKSCGLHFHIALQGFDGAVDEREAALEIGIAQAVGIV